MTDSKKPPEGSNHILINAQRIGTEERAAFDNVLKSSISPGPLAPYNIERAIKIYHGKLSPRLTIGQKFSSLTPTSNAKTPGPGAYGNMLSQTFIGSGKGYTIGMKLRLGNIMNEN